MTNTTSDTPYRVLITRDLTESATVVVRAASPVEAIHRATSHARENPDSSTDPHYVYPWEPGDLDLTKTPYSGDPEYDVEPISEEDYERAMSPRSPSDVAVQLLRRIRMGGMLITDIPLVARAVATLIEDPAIEAKWMAACVASVPHNDSEAPVSEDGASPR